MNMKMDVNGQIIDRLNGIYDMLWGRWMKGQRLGMSFE